MHDGINDLAMANVLDSQHITTVVECQVRKKLQG